MSDHVIETAGLRKRYDDVEALRGLDLQVPPGSIFGFLGRNGAGKTTTIKVLLGMARPSAGQATVFGLTTSSSARGRIPGSCSPGLRAPVSIACFTCSMIWR